MALFATPLLVLAAFIYPKPGQQTYSLIFAACAAFGFLNIASIRLYFDGRTVRYMSLMKRTVIIMDDVVGAKIGYSDTRGGNPFFFLSTRKKGDVLLNLPILDKEGSQDFCHQLMELGIYPEVENGVRTHLIAKSLYPHGWSPVSEPKGEY